MSKFRVLANLELSIELPEEADIGDSMRRTERKLLQALRRLIAESETGKGELERLALEGFGYANEFEAEPTDYYYNEHDSRASR